MTASSTKTQRQTEPECSIERCLLVLSDRWSFLILREALMGGVERFADFEKALGIAPNILTSRLERLVSAGVLTQRSYQEPGSRTRRSYHLTQSGKDLAVPLAALQQWGDVHDPPRGGPSVERRSPSGAAVRVGFLDEADHEVPLDDLSFVKAARLPGLRMSVWMTSAD